VVNLSPEAISNDSVTIVWKRPTAPFDYYTVETSQDGRNRQGASLTQPVGSCRNGKVIDGRENRATCGYFSACTYVQFIVRAISNGPPKRSFPVVSIRGLLVLGEDPDPPSNITTDQVSPSITRVEWDAPASASGNLGAYTVVVCDQYRSCDRQQDLTSCLTLQTNETWLDLDNSPVTKHCVLVTASSHCGARVLTSLPAIAEIATLYYGKKRIAPA
ncbi:hypothetical protein MTO96_041056, partial [Rhipicephalus appendiculatus]